MSSQIKTWHDPIPMDSGAPQPAILAVRTATVYCAYFVSSTGDVSLGRTAVLRFEGVLQHRFGYPNDEALPGHPLHRSGLQAYSFYVVEPSPLIAELEEQNRVHSRQEPGMYSSRFKHFIITFHDETLEVIARQAVVVGRSNLRPDEAVVEFAMRTQA